MSREISERDRIALEPEAGNLSAAVADASACRVASSACCWISARRTSAKRIVVLLLCIGASFWWGASERARFGATDFGVVYYGARCALHGKDPYNGRAMLQDFEAAGGKFPTADIKSEREARITITSIIYPPTALLVVAPLALLPWPTAQWVWFSVMPGLLVLAAFLIWGLSDDAPALSGCMTAFMLLNCVLLFPGNPAGIVVPLSVIAAFCFLRERFAVAGVVILAVALLMKPHDAGLVWLYFLLAGGKGRKRALQTLVLAGAFGVAAAAWIARSSPHWIQELHSNFTLLTARGGLADPGPSGELYRSFAWIVALQSTFSVFRDNPRFYGSASYLVGGGLIAVWTIAVLHKRATLEGALLALAAIAALTLLPVYHFAIDAKILLLTIPACAMLWAGRGTKRWVALGLTSAAIFVTSDVPVILFSAATGKLHPSAATLGGKLELLLLQPAPVVLLAAGCFFLWAYVGYNPLQPGRTERNNAVSKATEATAT